MTAPFLSLSRPTMKLGFGLVESPQRTSADTVAVLARTEGRTNQESIRLHTKTKCPLASLMHWFVRS